MPTTIKSQRLPSQPAQEWSEYTRAYGIVLNAELHAEERLAINPLGQKEKDNLIFARVTGFLLIELFDNRKILGVTPYVTLMAKITAPPLTGFTPHDLVFNLGKWHFDYFIRPYRTCAREWPTAPTHALRPDFDDMENMTADDNDYEAARNKALARDGFQCMVTGKFDSKSVLQNQELDQKCEEQLGGVACLQTCHIFGQSMTQGCEGSVILDEYAPTAIAVLKHFELGSLADKLLADGVHNLGNLLSLSPNIRFEFDDLGLWFEATEEPNCYSVCVDHTALKRSLIDSGHLRQDGDRLLVTFSSSTGAPLPNRQLLALHAVCARVAHLSGAFQAIDELEDVEDTCALTFDGSSHLLDHLIVPFATARGVV